MRLNSYDGFTAPLGGGFRRFTLDTVRDGGAEDHLS